MFKSHPPTKTLLPGLALLLVAAPSASWAACDIIVGSTANTSGAGTCLPSPKTTCTLRRAIVDATPGQTICFAEALKGQTIFLASSLTITKNLTIQGFGGPASNGITIDGSNPGSIPSSPVRIFIVGSCTGGPPCIPSANTVTFDGLILQNGSASGGRGGAIRQTDNANTTVTVLNSTFLNNSARDAGGAIANRSGALTVQNSTFSGNTVTASSTGALFGGGAVYAETGGQILEVDNSTFVNNSTFGATLGEAIRIASGSTGVIVNNTFSGNSDVTDTGGISNAGTLVLRNNILTGTTCNSSVAITGNNNLINGATSGDGATACGLIDSSAGNKIGFYNPALAALADNGGPTPTMAIASGSPPSNAGDNTTCMPTDQRGVTRPQGPACDMGAYEYTGSAKNYLIQIGGLTQLVSPCPTAPHTNYPQLSLSGVCQAQITLKNNTVGDTLTDITFKVNEISTLIAGTYVPNINWILNGVNGPDQVGTIVAGPASLAPGVSMTPTFDIGLMSRNTYRLRFSAFGTLNGADITSTGERRSIMKKKIIRLGDFEAKLKPGKGNE